MIDRQNNYIENSATNYIKGIALILMFVHHFFTFQSWYISGISYTYLSAFAQYMNIPSKICVPIFAFLTGYFYFYSKNKTLKYSLRKSTDVWLSYLIVFFILLLPAVFLGVYDFSVKNFVLELFALKLPTMVFCWYVVFYVTAMLILPLFARLSEKAPCFWFLLFLALPSVAMFFLDKVVTGEVKGFLKIVDYLSWFPCVGIGFLFAKYGLFHEFKCIVSTKSAILNMLIGFAFMAFAMVARYLNCSDVVCAPFFIFGIMEIYNNTKHKFIYKPISFIGKYSLIMWFIHCIFFNQCKEYTQPILYFFREPILVTLWGLLICLIIAVIIQIPTDALIKIKNKIFKLNNN